MFFGGFYGHYLWRFLRNFVVVEFLYLDKIVDLPTMKSENG